jgi:hypothetical protein
VQGGFGPRFAVEAIFLVAVAAVAVIAELETGWIVVVMALAWLLVAVAEWALAHRARRATSNESGSEAVSAPLVPEIHHVSVMTLDPDPAAQPVLEREAPEPVPEPEPEPEPMPEPVPPVPEPTPEPERPPALIALPPAKPEPEPGTEVEPEPPETVVVLPLPAEPHEWNLWELERLARERTGEDPEREEEWAYLFVYLREFATPDGTLPTDFDELVRESFSELLSPLARR